MSLWKDLWKVVVVHVDRDSLKTLQLWFWIRADNLGHGAYLMVRSLTVLRNDIGVLRHMDEVSCCQVCRRDHATATSMARLELFPNGLRSLLQF
ncbi:hypothetical protein BGZ90_011708 [Linnemannia elongata]|nr:hypothetical protein BGZ90_011708 [Linnemannia elongata]